MGDRFAHTLPFGATLLTDGETRFRIWAPSVERVTLEIDGGDAMQMVPEAGGWFAAHAKAAAGARYRFRLPDGLAVPDPASRAQAGDVHDWSIVVDPLAYRWQHGGTSGRPWHEAVIYEVHVGAAGGFAGVREKLGGLAALGFTAIELMPVADFPGARNWGYDGVLPFAPDAAYGTPDDLKALVDTAHAAGLMVLLDVVYNHFGPDGAYLHGFAKPFFNPDVHTPWGAAIDFERPEVQSFFIENALMWLQEYRFDGLRFDAVHAISPPAFLDVLAAAIRAGTDRPVHLVLEHEGNRASVLRRPGRDGGFDAQWTDDWHHCVHVLLTGESEGYYEDFQDPAPMLARALSEGFVYQGETSPHLGAPRGEPSAGLPATAFVVCLQNHDQIGNRAMGDRLATLASRDAMRAATTLLLLCPFIPLVFMGDEWGSERPFLFFTDHNEELAGLVREGRRREFRHFAAFKDEATRVAIPDPNALSTFAASQLDSSEREAPHHSQVLDLYRELLALRRLHIVPGIPGCTSMGASAIGAHAVLARWRMGDGRKLTLAANFGTVAVRFEPPGAAMLFTSAEPPTSGDLPGATTCAWLDTAA